LYLFFKLEHGAFGARGVCRSGTGPDGPGPCTEKEECLGSWIGPGLDWTGPWRDQFGPHGHGPRFLDFWAFFFNFLCNLFSNANKFAIERPIEAMNGLEQ